ncbi:MAG: hypothetical protein WAV56_00570, partial [Microgenomates group bacterium]
WPQVSGSLGVFSFRKRLYKLCVQYQEVRPLDWPITLDKGKFWWYSAAYFKRNRMGEKICFSSSQIQFLLGPHFSNGAEAKKA